MTIQGFGYAVIDYGSAWELDRKLTRLVQAGYSHAEVRPEGWQVWQEGRIDNRALARLTAVLDKHRPYLDYVMQLPTAVNLFDLTHQEHHQKMLRQGLKVGWHIGAKLLLYQPGHRPRRTNANFKPMSALMAQERETLRQLADEAIRWDSQIAMTTPDYAQTGSYSYAIWPDLLAQQVAQIDHERIGLCVDFSQLYVAANWCGFDYGQSIQRLAPLATHCHIQDAIGLMDCPVVVDASLTQSVTYLPTDWNNLPLQDILNGLSDTPALTMAFSEHLFFTRNQLPAVLAA